jgi:Fe-S cluster assembly protein SufD
MVERIRTPKNILPAEDYGALFGQAVTALPGDAASREASFARFKEQGFPGPKVEEWKYSPLGPIAKEAMALALPVEIDRATVAPYLIPDEGAIRLVFVNGHLAAELSDPGIAKNGRLVLPLTEALANGETGPLDATDSERGFDALNAAFASGGAVIRLGEGMKLDGPVQLLFVSVGGDAPSMVNVANRIELADRAELDLVETHLIKKGGHQLTNLVSRITVGENAVLNHDRLQLGEIAGSFIGLSDYRLAKEAKTTQTLATLGGGFVRNEVRADLEGSGIECGFNGVYLTRTGQHVDNVLRIDHKAPGSVSDQFYKGVLDGKAKAAFAGKIMVHRPAQQTNAYQTNNNLLLSPDAEINTKPELEIYADDVKCSHGATAGELDPRELFYLRSRGLDPEIARTMLTFAFAGGVLERFTNQHLLELAKRETLAWLPGGELLGEMIGGDEA